MDSTFDLSRRRCHRLAGASLLGALLPALGACAAGGGVRTQLLSAQRLNQLLASQFPYTRSFGGLAELSLLSPRLSLLPASNRLATAFDLALVERLAGGRYTGGLDLDYGLRFDAPQGAIRMADARVNRLAIDQLPRAQQQLVSQYAPRLAEHLLADLVIYRFPAEQLDLARNLGLGVGALRVLPEGLQVELAPRGPR
ncbi:MAG: hypothetical protein QM772_09875 [Ottowia sp.]|uniref:hypothetical protein n=1 Tax=Ottowia sp. TaxID=1898956 RepID=UPI0039E2A8BE